MNDSFLSQEEIDALLNKGKDDSPKEAEEVKEEKEPEDTENTEANQAIENNTEINQVDEEGENLLSDIERDALGEIGNIAAGSASTALSDLLGQKVMINTPRVNIIKPAELCDNFKVPYVLIEVNYTTGIEGTNLFILKVSDVAIISDIMMGGTGENPSHELDEIKLSAVSEAMNQMVGSSATAMSQMFNKRVDISPPKVTSVDVNEEDFSYSWSEDKFVVVISFDLAIGSLLHSEILQVVPIEIAQKEVELLLGSSVTEDTPDEAVEEQPVQEKPKAEDKPKVENKPKDSKPVNAAKPIDHSEEICVNSNNLNLILDVPLKISVVLGKTKKPIGDILNFNPGSIVELEKYADEPVDILVNGTLIAQGEVVVVNENFGVRITDILSTEHRIKNLGKAN